MKKALSMLLAALMLGTLLAGCAPTVSEPSPSKPVSQPSASQPVATPTPVQEEELEGEITFWHSFTQGPRLETI